MSTRLGDVRGKLPLEGRLSDSASAASSGTAAHTPASSVTKFLSASVEQRLELSCLGRSGPDDADAFAHEVSDRSANLHTTAPARR